ncbi:MAG: gamma-glutamyltransferase [Puniceicoccaceae bacterium]
MKAYTVATGHPLTSEAAASLLDAGGNAFDALLAGWLVSCLAEPVLTSPGGGGFAMVSPACGSTRLYDFFVHTPKTPNPDPHNFPVEADFGSTKQVFHLGVGTVATPGNVAGILHIHKEHGRLPVSECIGPAMDLSRNGLVITSYSQTLHNVVRDLYRATPESRALFQSRIEEEKCLREGEVFLNKDFAGFLEMLASEGSRWFYKGDIARMVSDHCQQNGGHLTRKDFEEYKIEVREPLRIQRNGVRLWLNPPPSMGGTLIALGLLSRAEAEPMAYPFTCRDAWLDWVEPLRLMSLLRTKAGFASLKDYEQQAISEASVRTPQLKSSVAHLFPHALGNTHATGTTQFSIMDSDGNEISMTTSNGSGSAIILPGTGFMLNNMLGEEDLQSEGLDTWEADSRLASMMSPTLAHLPGGKRIALGTGGSNRIRSVILQILRHLVDHGMSIDEAIEAPRLHWENHELHAETEAYSAISDLNDPLPLPLVEHTMPNLFFGGANAVAGSKEGKFSGIGDPRRGGHCITK